MIYKNLQNYFQFCNRKVSILNRLIYTRICENSPKFIKVSPREKLGKESLGK